MLLKRLRCKDYFKARGLWGNPAPGTLRIVVWLKHLRKGFGVGFARPSTACAPRGYTVASRSPVYFYNSAVAPGGGVGVTPSVTFEGHAPEVRDWR